MTRAGVAEDAPSDTITAARPGGARRWADTALSAFQYPVYRLIWLGSFVGF